VKKRKEKRGNDVDDVDDGDGWRFYGNDICEWFTFVLGRPIILTHHGHHISVDD